MDLAEKSLELLKSLERHAEHLPYSRDDLRTAFFLKVVECLNAFFFAHLSVDLASRIDAGQIKLALQPGHVRPENLEKILCLDRPPWRANYAASVNRHLLVDTWAAFEACNAGIAYEVLSRAEVEKMQLATFHEVCKVLARSGVALDSDAEDRLRQKLRTRHIPIPRMFAAIVKSGSRQYGRDRRRDMAFLDLYGRLRNSMHSNFVYHGQARNLVWRGTEFRFEDGRFPRFSCSEDAFPYLLLDMVDELTQVFDSAVSVVDHNEVIRDPIEEPGSHIRVEKPEGSS